MKNANFMLLEMALQDLTRRNIKWLLTQLEYHFESKQISVYSNLVKVFHLPEFPGKIILFAKLSGWFLRLVFTSNGVGAGVVVGVIRELTT